MASFDADELNQDNPASVAERAASGLPNDDPAHVTPPLPDRDDTDEPDVLPAKTDADASTQALATIDARFDVTTAGENWKHDTLEFKGDLLGIRLPTRQALAAFSLASSKYVALSVKNDLTGLFIARHLSEESYGRVFSRLMDPDEAAYTVDTVGELFNAIVTAAVRADKAAEIEAKKAEGKEAGDDAK